MKDKIYWDSIMQRYFAGCDNKHFCKSKKYFKKMKSEFKLKGLSKPESFTCELLYNETSFLAKNGLGRNKFNELWNYCKGNWLDKKIAEVEYDGLNSDGTPCNPIVVGIKEE